MDLTPKPVGSFHKVTLTGMLTPWDKGPIFLSMPSSNFLYLPCFSSEEKMRNLMGRIGRNFASIKKIMDSIEFLDSFRSTPQVKVILDPYFTPEGKVRFTQVE